MDVRYPNVEVDLIGGDGNAFAIIGSVSKALKRARVPADEVSEFCSKAMQSESYDHLLQFVMETVVVN